MTVSELLNIVSNYSISGSSVSSVFILLLVIAALIAAFRWQVSQKLDFRDLITYPNKTEKKVSLTRVLQLIGGITGTWIMIKLTIQEKLTWDLFVIYLTYVASIEGFSKFVQAKYNPTSKSDSTESK